ncbi:MAG: dynamin family protein [Candidatus Heimdallarchaeota archaeon]
MNQENKKLNLSHPKDVSDKLGTWLRNTIDLANSHSFNEIASGLQTLDEHRQMPVFRLVFAGEFNRGKSTLINRLLKRDLLPVGVLPTTATITYVKAGSEEVMKIEKDDGQQESLPLTEESWDDLVISETDIKQSQDFPIVNVFVENDWLRELDAELIDTPGAGDLRDYHTAVISDILNQCDAAVLLISANAPFSLTERTFLEEQIIGEHHIPRIMTVVSHLDTLSEKDKVPVLESVRSKVRRISPQISVLPSYPIDSNTDDVKVLDDIKSQIELLISKADRNAWRSQQIAYSVIDYLQQIITMGQTAIKTMEMEVAEQEEELQKAHDNVRKAGLKWEQIELDFDQRRIALAKNLRQKIMATSSNLLEQIHYDLSRTSDPKTWWEKDLPFRLKRDLMTVGRNIESFAINHLSRDFEWLQKQVITTFQTGFNSQLPSWQKASDPDLELQEVSLSDVQRLKLFTRIGSGAATIAGYMLFGPLGMAISIGAGVMGEYMLREHTKQQQSELKRHVTRSIERTLEEYGNLVSNRLDKLYAQLLQDIKQNHNQWLKTKYQAIEASRKHANVESWNKLIDEATTLKNTILGEL